MHSSKILQMVKNLLTLTLAIFFFRDTISASFADADRGAILTTHYMEEADALCSRVGIMVNGQME